MKLKKSDINSVLHGVNEEGPGTITQAMHMVKEREIGKLCYQAEEDLLSPGLALLKDMLAVKSSTGTPINMPVLRASLHKEMRSR